jgi:pyridoxal phosphate enzyme (YggS family)
MAVNVEAYREIVTGLNSKNVRLIAVSKTKPVEDIQALYDLGQRDFGENYVQELIDKEAVLPKDIRWHFIGHLQSNKVKYIAPFVHLIHGVDSLNLLKEINKQALKNDRIIDCLLQLDISNEDTKFGLTDKQIVEILEYWYENKSSFQNIRIVGLMSMASNTNDTAIIEEEFKKVDVVAFSLCRDFFNEEKYFKEISTGMSNDYKIAIKYNSTMVRIGSLLFGAREYPK